MSIRLTALAIAAAVLTPASHAQTPTTPPGATPAPVPCASVTPGLSDAIVMLSHIQDVLDAAREKTPTAEAALKKDPQKAAERAVGTTGGTSIPVFIERDKLDQIRAELEQIKVILKK
jgi:hypothetical protein